MPGGVLGKKIKSGDFGAFGRLLGFDAFPDPVRKHKHQFGFSLRKHSKYAKI